MIKTDSFVRSLMNKGFVDDVAFLTNGYDIQYNDVILSVRNNGVGGALIFNSKEEGVTEVVSGRLDDVLHRYIMQSLFGLQTGKGSDGKIYSNVFFKPGEVFGNCSVFIDPANRKWLLQGVSAKAAKAIYEEAMKVNADDAMILYDNFNVYDDKLVNSVDKIAESVDVELTLLRCSVDLNEYSVLPRSEYVNEVGRNLVNNFVCSSSDKIMLQNFEDKIAQITSCNGTAPQIDLELKPELKSILSLTSSKKDEVQGWISKKYGTLGLKSMKEALVVNAEEILSSLNIDDKVDFSKMFSSYMNKAENIQFVLKNNRMVEITVEKPGIFSATFKAVPDVPQMKDILSSHGTFLNEVESGLTLNLTDNMDFESTKLCSDMIKCCLDITPVTEEPFLGNSTVECIARDFDTILSSYGIEDTLGVIKYVDRITVGN